MRALETSQPRNAAPQEMHAFNERHLRNHADAHDNVGGHLCGHDCEADVRNHVASRVENIVGFSHTPQNGHENQHRHQREDANKTSGVLPREEIIRNMHHAHELDIISCLECAQILLTVNVHQLDHQRTVHKDQDPDRVDFVFSMMLFQNRLTESEEEQDHSSCKPGHLHEVKK